MRPRLWRVSRLRNASPNYDSFPILTAQCEQCEELLARFRAVAREFTALTRQLSDIVGSEDLDLILAVWNRSREAYAECHTLRRDVLDHFQTHDSNSRPKREGDAFSTMQTRLLGITGGSR